MPRRLHTTILATITLLGFTALLGVWWMGSHEGAGHLCIPAALNETACPNVPLADSSAFHARAFSQFFSNVLPTYGLAVAAFLVLLVALLYTLFRSVAQVLPSPHPGCTVTAASPPPRRDRLHWLAFHEHSPSLSPGRA